MGDRRKDETSPDVSGRNARPSADVTVALAPQLIKKLSFGEKAATVEQTVRT